MIDISQDIYSLSDFKRKTNTLIKRMKENGHPLVLTVNGKAQLVVQDAARYQELIDFLDHFEAIAGIQQGLKDVRVGKTELASTVFARFRKKHGLHD